MNNERYGSFGAIEFQEPDISSYLFYALIILGGGLIGLYLWEKMK